MSIPPAVLAQYQSLVSSANQTAQKPFQQYTGTGTPVSGTGYTSSDAGNFVAGINPTQTAGIAGTNTAATEAQPYYGAATSTLGGAQAGVNPINAAATGLAGASAEQVNAQPLTGQQINSYLSPYLGDVLGSTEALTAQQNEQAQSGALGTAISSGAFGGDRTGIAAANLQQQEQLAGANTYANIANTGYMNAQSVAQQQQGVNLSAQQANRAALGSAGSELAGIGSTAYGEGANTASELGALGSGAQAAGLSGAQAQIGAGTLQQQTQQAEDTAQYNQFLQQQSFPYQVGSWLAGISEGTGALSGSTTTTTQPGGFFSDRRLKHDIKKIGKTYDGQTIYSYKMHGDARTHIGLMAQDVEKKHPESVGLAGGYKFVDYGAATEKAANRGHFYEGGTVTPMRTGLAVGGTPYSPGVIDTGIPMSRGRAGSGVFTGGLGASAPAASAGPGNAGGLIGMATGAQPQYARGGFADGGYSGPYGDLSSILATQENMYQPNQTKNRNIPAQSAQSHQLAVASGSPTPPPSGASNVQTAIGLGKDAYSLGSKGYNAYQNSELTPVQMSPNAVTLPDAGASSPVAAPSADASGLAGAEVAPATAPAAATAPTAGLAAAPAADAAASAAVPAAADAAASIAAPAAADAAVGAGTEAAAALAAEYAAADVGVAALALAKRGGRIKRAGLDAGGVPYEGTPGGDPYSAPGGQMDIPDAQGADKLQTAGPLKKQPTGFQDMLQMGNIMDAGSTIGTVFSNQGLGSRRGGRIGKDGGGDVDGSQMLLPEIEVDAQRPDPEEQGPPAGLAAAPTDLSPVEIDPSDTKLDAPKRSGLSAVGDFWDRNKTNIIPALEGLAAMGTAPTKHLGVALAAGLGAGAGSYFPTQQAQANVQATNLQNQRTQYQLNALQAPPPSVGSSSGPPPQPGFSGVGADPSNIAAEAQRRYAFKDVWTPQEQANLQAQQAKQNAGLPNTLPTIQAMHTARMQNQQTAQQQGALGTYNAAYQAANAAPGTALAKVMNIDPLAAKQIQERSNGDADAADNMARVWAGEVGNQTYQQTGRKPVTGTDGIARDPFSQRPILGQTPVGMSAEQHAAYLERLATPVDTGAPSRPALGATAAGSGLPANPQPTTTLPGSGTPPAAMGSQARQTPRGPLLGPPPSQSPNVAGGEPIEPKYQLPKQPTVNDPQTPETVKTWEKTIEKRAELLDDSKALTASSAQGLVYVQAAQALMKTNGVPTGLSAPAKVALSRFAQATGLTPGVSATQNQELAKYLGNLAVQNFKQNFGARPAAKEFDIQMGELNPESTMTPTAINNLLDFNSKNLNYMLQTAHRAAEYSQKNGDPQQFYDWNNAHFPMSASVNGPQKARQQTSGPATIASKADYDALPKGAAYTYNGRSGVKQ